MMWIITQDPNFKFPELVSLAHLSRRLVRFQALELSGSDSFYHNETDVNSQVCQQ
jgi:hypothetical protein